MTIQSDESPSEPEDSADQQPSSDISEDSPPIVSQPPDAPPPSLTAKVLGFLWPGGGLRWVAIGVYAAAVVAVVVVIALLMLLGGLSRPGEATAEFIPSNALFYSSINLRPGMGQIDKAINVGELLRTDDFIDEEEDLLENVEDETGIHPLDDVTSWLGTDITFALLDLDEDEGLIEWVLMVQIKDQDEALDFVDDLRDYFEDELYTEFDDDEIGGAEVWIADDEDLAIGLTDEYLLLTDSEDTMEDILDNIDSPPRSLPCKGRAVHSCEGGFARGARNVRLRADRKQPGRYCRHP